MSAPFEGASQLPVRDRPFTAQELERLRLLLSLYRDGSGQLLKKYGYMPDYRDFERCTAYVCSGDTTESKAVFDVLVPGGAGRLDYGISCKMTAVQRKSWFIEMSNSSKKFHDALNGAGVSWKTDPIEAGPILVRLVESWHQAVKDEVELAGSRYLLLTHDARWAEFEIACFDLDLQRRDLDAEIEWVTEGQHGPSTVAGYIEDDEGNRHRLWQFYANAGGQLKYYPLFGWEEWRTGSFRLEEPPTHDLADRVREYWPGRWPE